MSSENDVRIIMAESLRFLEEGSSAPSKSGAKVRPKGVMIWALSQQPARRNCSTGEDAGYPRQDGKTPWSFTVA